MKTNELIKQYIDGKRVFYDADLRHADLSDAKGLLDPTGGGCEHGRTHRIYEG